MGCTTEEECRRLKILLDSQVSAASSNGIGMAVRGELTMEQVQDWIALDEEYLQRQEKICAGGVS